MNFCAFNDMVRSLTFLRTSPNDLSAFSVSRFLALNTPGSAQELVISPSFGSGVLENREYLGFEDWS